MYRLPHCIILDFVRHLYCTVYGVRSTRFENSLLGQYATIHHWQYYGCSFVLCIIVNWSVILSYLIHVHAHTCQKFHSMYCSSTREMHTEYRLGTDCTDSPNYWFNQKPISTRRKGAIYTLKGLCYLYCSREHEATGTDISQVLSPCTKEGASID